MKSFAELTDAEKSTALDKVYVLVMNDIISGAKEPLDEELLSKIRYLKARYGPYGLGIELAKDSEVHRWVSDISSVLARDAYYIPDDGRMVVRI